MNREITISSEEIEARLLDSLNRNPGITLWLDIINKCNLRCIMCHFSNKDVLSDPVECFTSEEFKAFFDGIAPYVRKVVLSCGAEPLVSKYFSEILTLLSDYPTPRDIEFCTNAMLMDARIRNLIIEKGITYILLSMDGIMKSTLERIRVGSRYEQVVGNIMALRDLKQSSGSRYPIMHFIFVMMNSNIHEAPVFIELAKNLGAEMVEFHHVVPGGLIIKNHEEMLSNHQSMYNYYREKIIGSASLNEIKVILPPAFDINEKWEPTEKIPRVDLTDFEQVQPNPAEGRMPIPKAFPSYFKPRCVSGIVAEEFSNTFCHLPFSQIMIRNQDEVLACGFHKTPVGRLSDGKSLIDIFLGEGFRNLRRNMYLTEGDPNCYGCPVKIGLLPTKIEQIREESITPSFIARMKKRLNI